MDEAVSAEARYRDIYRAEAAELKAMADGLSAPFEQRFELSQLLARTLDTTRWDDEAPRQIEMRLELASRHLRRRCLEAAHAAADRCWKSPPQKQALRTAAGQAMDHGYERELQPVLLEERLAGAAPPPEGWHADHVLFSSGQAALTTIVLARSDRNRLRVDHVGGYFETRDLFGLLTADYHRHEGLAAAAKDTGLLLAEPAFCAEGLHWPDLTSLREFRPGLLVLDTTLAGATFDYRQVLEASGGPVVMLRSGLKLDQAGLELANVGIVSLYSRTPVALGEDLRRIRGLIGAGLTLDEMAALEAPWFLDPDHAGAYARAVFESNAALARALGGDRDGDAPFCVLHLDSDDPAAYRAFERAVEAGAKQRGLLFDRGGSFGFRGHRFEAVIPHAAQGRPFLRIAMGARAGWSCDGIVDLMRGLAPEWKRKMREAGKPAAA